MDQQDFVIAPTAQVGACETTGVQCGFCLCYVDRYNDVGLTKDHDSTSIESKAPHDFYDGIFEMAIPHARPAEPFDVRPLGADLKNAQTATLVKTDSLEVIRLVLPVGKDIKPHEVPSEITVQCLEGKVAFRT